MADDDKKDGGNDDRKYIVQLPTPSRKRHVPTEDSKALAFRAFGMGMTIPQVGHLLGIHHDTVAKYYDAEHKAAEGLLTFNVASNLYSIATSPTHKNAVTAAIFWMKTRGGWREVTRVEHTGADGGAIQHDIHKIEAIPARNLSPDERDALKGVLIEAMKLQSLPPVAMPETDHTVYTLVEGEEDEESEEEDDEPEA